MEQHWKIHNIIIYQTIYLLDLDSHTNLLSFIIKKNQLQSQPKKRKRQQGNNSKAYGIISV